MTGRRTIWSLGALALGAAALALVPKQLPKQDSQRAGERHAPGDTLVAAVSADPGPLIAVSYEDSVTATVLELISPVMTIDEFRDGVLLHGPALATSWSWSADGKALTYTLRDDVNWEAGHPLTAEDIVFTYQLLRDPRTKSPRSSFGAVLEPQGGVVALDPHRVQFKFLSAYDPNLQLYHSGHSPVPKYVFENVDPAKITSAPYGQRPKSEGPFSLVSWAAGQGMVLERNRRARTHDVPLLDRIVLQVHPDYAQRINLLEKGDVDLVESVQFKDISRLKALGTVNLLNRGRRGLEYVVWNLKDPLFESREARRALTLGIDRGRIVKSVLADGQGGVYGSEAVSSFTPDLAAFKDIGVAPLPYDPEAARKLLERAGWKDSDGDGVLDRAGKRFEFSLLVSVNSQRRLDVAVLVQSDLKKVGVAVNIETVAPGVLWEDRLLARKFQAAIWGLLAPLIPDPRDGWHSGESHRFNLSGFANPKADELMDRGIVERDQAKAGAIWRELAAVIYEDQPCTFLYWFDQYAAIHRRFQGVVPSPVSLFHGVEKWWVPPAQQKHKE